MDIGASQIVGEIASGTTSYLVTYSPVFIFAAGLVLALGIIGWLISTISGRRDQNFDDDERRDTI